MNVDKTEIVFLDDTRLPTEERSPPKVQDHIFSMKWCQSNICYIDK